jgi:Domain of unknown function (DUF2017)
VSRRFTRRGDAIVLALSEAERELLMTWVPGQLHAVYDSQGTGDPARSRLFPVAYLDPTEEDAEGEWQALVHPELLRARLDALATVVRALEGAEPRRRGDLVVEMAPDDVAALLGVLNDVRLALGTMLGVTEDSELADLDPDDPAAPTAMIYLWLTHLEGELVDTLLGDMPD